MNQEQLDLELKQLVSKIRLKEPPQKLMENYVSEVNTKIDHEMKNSSFGFPQLTVLLAVGFALAGLVYFFFVSTHPRIEPAPVAALASRTSAAAGFPASEDLSLEDQMALLEAFSGEYESETADSFGDDELLEELASLDELELSYTRSSQTSGV